jgi:hypothetical protein
LTIESCDSLGSPIQSLVAGQVEAEDDAHVVELEAPGGVHAADLADAIRVRRPVGRGRDASGETGEQRQRGQAVLPRVEFRAAGFVPDLGDVLNAQLLGDPVHLRIGQELPGRPGVKLHFFGRMYRKIAVGVICRP